MAKIKVVAGDIEQGSWAFHGSFGSAKMHRITQAHPWMGETIDLTHALETAEPLNEEKVKKLAGTAGWGIAGGALLGPLGLIGGALLGGNKTEVAFAAYLKDGRKFMGSTDAKTWKKLLAAAF